MAIPAPVVALLTDTIRKNVGPVSKTAAETLTRIIIEYSPRSRAQAEIMRAVAKVAPWAIGVVSAAFALVLAKIGFSESIRLAVQTEKAALAIEGHTKSSQKIVKRRKASRRKPRTISQLKLESGRRLQKK